MKIIGITGGVGSGKSRILNILKTEYQAYVAEADRLAHMLMEPGRPVYDSIVRQFGEIILDDKGNIDRRVLGSIVFRDEKKLECLNSLTHPAVKEEIKRLIREKEAEGHTPYFVIEAALLLQDGYREICDEIWFVKVDREERIRRLMRQRNYTREKCIDIFLSQPDDAYYEAGSDFVINNNGDFDEVCRALKKKMQS